MMSWRLKSKVGIFTVFLLALLAAGLSAGAYQRISPGGLEYQIADGSVTITGYRGNATHLEIPARLSGYPVTRVQSHSIQENSALQQVSLPSSLLQIDGYALMNNPSLSRVIIYSRNAGISPYFSWGGQKVTILGYPGSSAEQMASDSWLGYRFLPMVPRPVQAITIAEPSLVLSKNESYQLSFHLMPLDASIKELNWSSSDDTVVSVYLTGVVVGYAQGSAVITATAKDSRQVAASIRVEVKEAIPFELQPYWDHPLLTYNGTEQQVNLQQLPEGLSVLSITGHKATEAGEYTANATVVHADARYAPLRMQPYHWSIHGPQMASIKAEALDANRVKLSWPQAQGATGYEVWDGFPWNESSIRLYRGVLLSRVFSGLTPDTYRYFYVRTFRNAGGVSHYGPLVSLEALPIARPARPEAEVRNGGNIHLQWERVSNGDSFELWRLDRASGQRALLYRGYDKTEWLDSGVSPGKLYSYSIRPYFGTSWRNHISVDHNYDYFGPSSLQTAAIALEKPSAPLADQSRASDIRLSWHSIAFATGYELWRDVDGSGNHIRVYRGSARAFTDVNVATGKIYSYKVRPYRVIENISYNGPFSEKQMAAPLSTPAVLHASVMPNSQHRLTWDAVPYADGYELYGMYVTADGYEQGFKMYQGSETQAEVNFYGSGVVSVYSLRAYRVVHGETFYSGPSPLVISANLRSPESFLAGYSSGTRVRMTWQPAHNATGYELWRSESPTGEYQRVYRGITPSRTDTGLTAGSQYYWKVRAFVNHHSVSYFGPFAEVKSYVPLARPAAPPVSGLNASSLNLSWQAIPGASGYEIQRAAEDGVYATVYTGTALSLRQEGLQTGHRYNYQLRAFVDINGSRHYSPYSGLRKIVPLDVPTTPVSQPGEQGNGLSWSSIAEATGYEVWANDSTDQAYYRIYRGARPSFIDSRYEGWLQEYKVRAYRVVNEISYYSEYSQPFQGAHLYKPTPPQLNHFGWEYELDRFKVQVSIPSYRSYELWRWDTRTETYQLIYDGQEQVMIDSNLQPNTGYRYKLRTYLTDNNAQRHYSLFSNISTGAKLAQPESPSFISLDGSISFSWSSVDGVSGYRLLQGSSNFLYTGPQNQFLLDAVPNYSGRHYNLVTYIELDGAMFTSSASKSLYAMAIATPATLHVGGALDGSIRLSWQAEQHEFAGYEVMRATSPDGVYQSLGSTQSRSFMDTGAIPGNTYYYKVHSFSVLFPSIKGQSSDVVSALAIRRDIPGPPLLSSVHQEGAVLYWSPVEDITGYELLRIGADGSRTTVYAGPNQAFEDLWTAPPAEYTYSLRACLEQEGNTYYGSYSQSLVVNTLQTPGRPAIGEFTGQQATLTWALPKGISGTQIQILREGYPPVVTDHGKSGSATIYVHEFGIPYHAQIRHYISTPAGTAYSDWSEAVVALLPQRPSGPSISMLDASGASLTWGQVSPVTGYELWCSEGSGEYVRVYRGGQTQFEHLGLNSLNSFSYKVRSYVVFEEKSYYSAFSAQVSLVPRRHNAAPAVEQADENALRLTWADTWGATGHELWRSDDGAEYVRVYRGQAFSYQDRNLFPQIPYTYKVRAYSVIDGVSIYGSYGDSVTAITE